MNEVVFVIIRNIVKVNCLFYVLLLRKNRGGNYIFEGWGGDGLGNVFEEDFFLLLSRVRIYFNCFICYFGVICLV